MIYLILSLGIFFLCVTTHILWCRIRRRNELQMIIFVVLACMGLLVYFGLAFQFCKFEESQPISLWNMPLLLSSGLLYIFLTPVYMAFYFNTRVESPTQKILKCLQGQKARYADLLSLISDEEIIIPRLNDLKRTQCIQEKEGAYQLTKRGYTIGRFLELYQKLTGRPWGG